MPPLMRLIAFATITAVVVSGLLLFRTLFPLKANLNPVENPVRDRASDNWEDYESRVVEHELKQVYFGDLHVHTNLSFDAYIGGTLQDPADAYRFALGQPVSVFNSLVRIERPLDFTAVTDHSETLGEMYTVNYETAPGHDAFIPRIFRSVHNPDKPYGVDTKRQLQIGRRVVKRITGTPRHPAFFRGFETTKSAWSVVLEAAEAYYKPGKFTTFAGFEWSLMDGHAHLHRNVIFRDMRVPDYPVSSLEITHEENLWLWLDSISRQGATVLAIPHNTNLAEGGAFRSVDADGRPMDRAYAQLRQDYEPLIEIHQAKGNSEIHAAFWKNDEFSGFENLTSGAPREDNYVRWALKKGLEHEANLGVNPFKFGLIGSTDTHTGTPGNTEEADSFLSNHGILDFLPQDRHDAPWVLDEVYAVHEVLNPGGLIAVWAPANTRGHLYDAMKQKEVYATSGSRMRVRFFGGTGFPGVPYGEDNLAREGYAKGVAMGGDLRLTAGQAPEFLIRAEKDPLSANLDRIQVVKGWYVPGGAMRETIYEVAWSGDREPVGYGRLPQTSATVDTLTGQWDRSQGDTVLTAHWTDPDFDPEAYAFYYVRVLENPTASWRLWDRIRYGAPYTRRDGLTVQERAWSSPIWYSPPGKQGTD